MFEKTYIYLTVLYDNVIGNYCVYVGSHLTHDPLWPNPGCTDPYIGSSRVAMQGEHGCTVKDLKPRFTWVSTTIQEDERIGTMSTLAIEGEWIYSCMCMCGIHPLAKNYIRHCDNDHPLLKFPDGTCLNAHTNSKKFANTEYYEKWIASQGERSALGNSPEARAKALATLKSHYAEILGKKSAYMKEFVRTEYGQELQKKLSALGNSPEARAKASETRKRTAKMKRQKYVLSDGFIGDVRDIAEHLHMTHQGVTYAAKKGRIFKLNLSILPVDS